MSFKLDIPRIGLFYAVLSSITFGISTTMAAQLSNEIGEYTTLVFRVFFMCIFSSFYLIKDHKQLELSKSQFIRVVLCSLMMFGSLYFSYKSFTYIPALEASTLINTQPFFLLVIGYFFLKESISRYEVVGVVIILFSVPFVTQPEFLFGNNQQETSQFQRLIGSAFAICSSISIASCGALVRCLTDVSSSTITFYQGVISTVLAIVIGYENMNLPNTTFQIILLVIGSISGSFARSLATLAYLHEDCTIVGSIESLELVMVALLQYPIMKILPNYITIIGSSMLICAIFIMAFKEKIPNTIRKVFRKCFKTSESAKLLANNEIKSDYQSV